MRRLVLCSLLILVATAAGAGAPHFLDRNGLLWSATPEPEGLVLTAQRDGSTVLRTTVPFAVATAGASDSEIQVAGDELTGKVTVVWQRNWSATLSEIMLGVWSNGTWERLTSLSADMSTHPRYPAVQLSRVRSTAADPAAPDDPSKSVTIEDSFLQVAWWQGSAATQHGMVGLVRLTAAPDEEGAVYTRDLDELLWLGVGCAFTPSQSILERPLFASQPVADRAYLFHGSRRACLFQLVEISFRLEDPPSGQIIVSTQRRRHTPVFGVKKLYSVPGSMSLEGARFLVGTDLNPVAYRVTNGKIEYITSTGIRWTPKRSLAVGGDLSIDEAIPLVENLAH